jgi:plastocyanin
MVVRNEEDPGHGHGVYFVTAIDYHFHDAHPTVPLTPDRVLVVTNEGSDVHNVTIPGTTFSRDVRPGHSLYVGRIGSLFTKPGRYPFFCRYHLDRGMKGVIVVR